jgi:hypothetical protein
VTVALADATLAGAINATAEMLAMIKPRRIERLLMAPPGRARPT